MKNKKHLCDVSDLKLESISISSFRSTYFVLYFVTDFLSRPHRADVHQTSCALDNSGFERMVSWRKTKNGYNGQLNFKV